MSDVTRQPHAVLDLHSRRKKAEKILRLLNLQRIPQPIRLLDVGAGAGGIAQYFGNHPEISCQVTAVDVEDLRQVCDGYRFVQVDGVELPFEEESFDVVLSNHVIEHVGDRSAQLRHLQEVRRVMAANGVGYLAVPNRWMLVEPHYKLLFLSWLPRTWRTPYLRLMRRGKHYDCEPLSLRELDALLDEAGFEWEHVESEALRLLIEIENPSSPLIRWLANIPEPIWARLRGIIPTLICRLRRGVHAAR